MSEYISIEVVEEKLDIDKPINILHIYKSRKKKHTDSIRRQQPEAKKRHSEREKIRKAKKRLEPGYNKEEVNAKQRAIYGKNPETQKKSQ